MATTGYQAGLEVNNTQLSYGLETTFKTAPAVQFQGIRYTSETLAGSKSRQRPSEINTTRESSAAVTVSETASGTINGALSFGTYDDFFASALQSSWQAAQVIAGVAADVTLTNVSSTSATLSSTTTNKFANIAQGQWIRLLGFSNAVNNGFFRVTTKTDAQHLTLVTPGGATITEVPTGTNFQARASTIQNGTTFTSLFIQQSFSSSVFLQYAGAYPTSVTVAGQLGQFFTSNFTMVAVSETQSTTNASTGAVLAAPTGTVMNTVGNFGGVYVNDVSLASTATIDQISLTFANDASAAEYGLGSSIAAGILGGTFLVSGSFRMFWKDFTYYQCFKTEQAVRLSFITRDGAGNAYVWTLPNCYLMNPTVDAGGPGQAVLATFTLEGAPQTGGGTLIIDRLPAT